MPMEMGMKLDESKDRKAGTLLKVNDAYIQELCESVNCAPFPKHLPFRLESVEIDKAVVTLAVAEYHKQPFGMVHGGVLATLIDTATFWAAFLRLPEDAGLVNIDLNLNYLRPVTSGLLKAEGKCLKAGRTISYAEASVVDADGVLCVSGSSTLMVLPGKGISMRSRKFLV